MFTNGINLAPFLVNVGPGDAGLQSKVFFIWGSTCACCIVFTYFCIPETKGLSLEQVDLLYQYTNPWNSVEFRNKLIAEDVHISDRAAIARVTGQPVPESDEDSKDMEITEKV